MLPLFVGTVPCMTSPSFCLQQISLLISFAITVICVAFKKGEKHRLLQQPAHYLN